MSDKHDIAARLAEALSAWQDRDGGGRYGRTPTALAEIIGEANKDRGKDEQITGVRPATMLRYFKGLEVPRCDTLLEMARLMGANPCYLLTGRGAVDEAVERPLFLVDGPIGDYVPPPPADRAKIRQVFDGRLLDPDDGFPDYYQLNATVRTLFRNLMARNMVHLRDNHEYPQSDDLLRMAKHRGLVAGRLAREMCDWARREGWNGVADGSRETTGYMVQVIGWQIRESLDGPPPRPKRKRRK